MIRILRLISFLIFLIGLAAMPVKGICQIATPTWVDDIGGPGSSSITAQVKVDKQNNIYITGIFQGTVDFDPSAGVYNLTSNSGSFDTFVAKYTTNGALIWAVAFGGDNIDQVNDMVLDANGNPTVIGQYNSSGMDADPGPGVSNLVNNGDWDAFIVKFDTNGKFIWGKSIGGVQTDYGQHVSVDASGNIVAVLKYEASVSVGSNNFTSQGAFNGLVIKYDSSGNLQWAINMADGSDCEAKTVVVDGSNNIIVSGNFTTNDNFNPLGAPYHMNGNGGSLFIAKYSPSGILLWAKPISGNAVNSNVNLCVNSNNDIFLDGPFSTPLGFNSNAITLNPMGQQDVFLAKYNSNGIYQWAEDIGGAGGTSIYNYGIVCSADNYIYISGYFSGTVDFDPSATATALKSDHGQRDLLFAKYDANGNYKWAFNTGNTSCNNTLGRNLTIDGNNDILLTGSFCSTVNFDGSKCSFYNLTAQSNIRDSFLGKYVQSKPTPAAQITAFSVPGEIGAAAIDQTKLQITITVPAGTDITNLSPTITFSSGVTLSPASGVPENFSSPVTYTLTNAACYSLNYSVNVVFANPAKPVTTCSGISDILTGDAANPTPNSYLWQELQNGVWINAPGTNNAKDYQASALVNNTNANVVFSLRRQITTGANVTDDSFYDVTVQPPTANNTITTPVVASFCSSGDPANITGSVATGGNGTYSYQWQSSADGTNFTDISGATSLNYDPPVINVTTYYRRVVTSGACTAPLASTPVVITINSVPATPSASPANICAGSSATLSVSSPQQGVTYDWYDSPARTNHLSTGANYTTSPLNANQTFYIEATNAGGCTSTILGSVQVTVNTPPTVPAVTGATSVCNGTSATLNIQNPQSASTYNWYAAPSGGSPAFTGATFITPAVTSSITYYVDATNGGGCTSARTAVNLSLNAQPDVSAQGAAICPGTTTTLTAVSTDNNVTISWYSSASGGSPLFAGPSFATPALNSNTTYYAEAVDNITGCVSAVRAQVQVQIIQPLAAPEVTVSATTTSSVTFQWSAVSGATGYQVSTDGGQTFSDPSSGSDGLSHTVSGLQAEQSVTIIVRATGSSACAQSANSAGVTGTAASPLGDQVFVPNAFTPNGDGKNDIVYVRGPNIRSIKFYVYDQWGEMIYSTVSLASGWDGTYKGSKEPVGVYVYYVEATMNDGKQVNRKGTITLLR